MSHRGLKEVQFFVLFLKKINEKKPFQEFTIITLHVARIASMFLWVKHTCCSKKQRLVLLVNA